MLVIPKTGDEPTQTLRFLKSRSTVVHIGRASSSLGDAEKSPDTIQFRCPVISRRHAKLMFSSGHVYIVDLHSHHGTHLLRRDEIVSRPILPDVPIVLQDGDTLTFGKAVGKEPYSVSPITANVMLIYDTEAAPASPVSPPIISLVDSPPSPTTPIKGKQPLAAPKSSSSGRYGLFGPHSPASQSQSSPAASSEEDFSQSDHDGEEDEEEDEDDYYPDPSEDYPFSGHGQAHNSNNSVCYAPLPSLQGLGLLASRHVMHHAPPAHMYAHAAHTHMNMHVQPLSPSLELWFDSPQRLPAPNPTTNNNNTSHEIGAEEPMDISSPPSPTVANLLHDVPEGVIEEALRTEAHVPAETPIIGAYPGSPIRSAVVSPWCSDDVEEELQCDLVHDEVIMEQRSCNPESLPPPRFISAVVGTPGPASSIIAQASECATEHHFAEDDDDAASDIDADGDADVDVDPTPVSTTSAPASVPLDVPLLTSVAVAGPSTTTTTNNNNTGTGAAPAPGAITGSGMAIDARVTSLDEALVNLWGNVLRMQIAHRKTQTDHKALSDRTEALAARLDAAHSDLRSAIGAHEDAEVLRTRVVAAEALMAELQARLVSAEARMAEAEQAAAVVEQPQQQQTEVPTTRKRKREDEEDAGEVAEVKPREKCRNRKRARRFAWAAVHTAAAAAVGAVAAWSALAFA
jgi:pSer/pThr/pTyr-binding forkhead associated (FHA) protein